MLGSNCLLFQVDEEEINVETLVRLASGFVPSLELDINIELYAHNPWSLTCLGACMGNTAPGCLRNETFTFYVAPQPLVLGDLREGFCLTVCWFLVQVLQCPCKLYHSLLQCHQLDQGGQSVC